MTQQFVKILADVHCECDPDNRSVYRLYIGDELFTERTWIWSNAYLEEVISILAEPGDYKIHYELVPNQAEIRHTHVSMWNVPGLNIQNLRVAEGSATIQDSLLRIR